MSVVTITLVSRVFGPATGDPCAWLTTKWVAVCTSPLMLCSYNFVSIAISNTDESSKQAMTGQVTTPGAIP